MVVVHLADDSALDGPRNVLNVHEVAVGATVAAGLVERTATGLTEVGHGGVLGLDELATVEAASELHQCALSILFVVVLHIHIADHVVAEIVHHDQILNLSVVGQLKEHLNVEGLKVLLRTVVHVIIPRLVVRQRQGLRRVRVHVGQQESLTHRRPIVQSVALVAIAACPDLEVERAIDAVLLSPEDARKLLSHGWQTEGSGLAAAPTPTITGC
mmetsp:Transcript_70691/g.182260  ORF Transcript_70691/g.182260 Transcript_70691/m.182260 type:complete len:214 (+) Transcript_70691:625-1266(+)